MATTNTEGCITPMSNQHERPAQTTTPEQAPVPEVMRNNEHMLGLTTRLLLGGEQLNPAHVIPEVNAQNLRLSDGTTTMISRASGHNRETYWANRSETTFDARVTAWKTETKNALQSLNIRLASDTDKQTRWKEVFSQAGIGNIDALTDTHMQTFYDRYFSGEDKESNISRFVEDMARKYITEGQPVNYDAFYQDMDAISWVGNVFGDKISAILPSLIEARLMRNDDTKREEVARKANQEENGVKRVNRLADGANNEKDLLTYLWTYGRAGTTPDVAKNETPQNDEKEKTSQIQEEQIVEDAPDKTHTTTPEELPPIMDHTLADRLLDFSTGKPKDEMIDLSVSFPHYVEAIKTSIDEGKIVLQEGKPNLIFSDTVLQMIDQITTESNERDQERVFTIIGVPIEKDGKIAFISAYVVPVMNYANGRRTTCQIDPEVFDQYSQKLAENTNLNEYFRTNTGYANGMILATLHTHQESLGKEWQATPSSQDYSTADENARSEGYYTWGVLTKSGDTIHNEIVYSYLNRANGQVMHEKMPIFAV